MSIDKNTHSRASTSNSKKPKKLIRSKNPPVYADELAEIKLSSHTTKLTFGILSSEDNNEHHIINESVTVIMPTASFMSSVTQMILPIIENQQLLEMIRNDYKKVSDQAEIQLKQLRSIK